MQIGKKQKYIHAGDTTYHGRFAIVPHLCNGCDHRFWLEYYTISKNWNVDSGGDWWTIRSVYCHRCRPPEPVNWPGFFAWRVVPALLLIAVVVYKCHT